MTPRVAIVTGAAAGIGRAVALMLAGRGYAVVAADLDEAGAQATAAAAADAVAIGADIAERGAAERLVATALERWDRLDALLLVAGVSIDSPLAAMSDDAFDRVIDVNLGASFRCCRAALPALRESRGAAVTFGSVLGRSAMSGQGAYAASKAALEALTRTLAVEHAPDGVRFNCVIPGSTDTALMWLGVDADELAGAREAAAADVPLGRVADPREVAELACFLVSPAASFITGTSVVADGGMLAKLAATY